MAYTKFNILSCRGRSYGSVRYCANAKEAAKFIVTQLDTAEKKAVTVDDLILVIEVHKAKKTELKMFGCTIQPITVWGSPAEYGLVPKVTVKK